MKARIVQFSPMLGNVEWNFNYHASKIKDAINEKIDLIVFPELSLTGYQLKDIIYDIPKDNIDKIIIDFMELSKDIDIVIGLPFEESQGIFYNSALYFSEGKILHNHKKVQLPNFGMFEEKMIFKAGNSFKSFRTGNLTVGILICREILFPVNAYLYHLQNTDLIISVSNSPHRGMGPNGFESHKLWERLGEVYSIHYHQNFIFCNRTGFEDGIGFGGGSFYASSGKGIVNMGKYFDEQCINCEIDDESIRRSRIGSNYLRDEKPDIILKEMNRIINE